MTSNLQTIRPLDMPPGFATEDRLRTALTASRLGFWELDLATGTIAASATCKASFGRGADEDWNQDLLLSITHPDDRGRLVAAIEQTVRTRTGQDIEIRIMGADAHISWLLVRSEVACDCDGFAATLYGTSMDITLRKKQEAALQLSQRELLAVTDSIDHLLWSAGPDGVTDFRNQRWYDYTGMSRELSSSQAWETLVHEDDRQRAWATMQAALASGRPCREELRLRHRSGAWRWNLSQMSPVVDDAGRTIRWHGSCTDIQEIVEARELLSSGKAELERVVVQRTLERDHAWKHSLDLQLIIGPDGFIRAANEAWRDVLGWQADQVVGQHFLQFTHPDDREATEAAMRTARDEPLRRFEKRCLHSTDGFRWIAWVAAPEGDLVYASGRDVTAEREQAAALERVEQQLRQSQKMEAIGQLTGGLTHDFNNYLGVIRNSLVSLRLLVTDVKPEACPDEGLTRSTLERAERAVQRAAALTQRLTSFARDQPQQPESTDLRRLLVESAEMIHSSLPSTIAFELAVSHDAPCVAFVDANNLDNALLNLCLNARDAMPKGGRLTLSAGERTLDAAEAAVLDLPPGRYACIAVADSGIGMDDDLRSRIFDPFFTTKSPGEGTGLGLSMVYSFARQSGGQVVADSLPGAGTTMRLYLPCEGP